MGASPFREGAPPFPNCETFPRQPCLCLCRLLVQMTRTTPRRRTTRQCSHSFLTDARTFIGLNDEQPEERTNGSAFASPPEIHSPPGRGFQLVFVSTITRPTLKS